jgi:lysophospholipase L1-like esterase
VSRRVLAVLVALAGALAALVPTSIGATLLGLPVGKAKPSASYVALGDSYSAASGVAPLDPNAAPECARANRNYPKVIAGRTGMALTDVTCGGAETKDYFSSQYQGVAPQLNALNATTKLVTMTIGGNDSGVFIGAIAKCGSLGIANAGKGSPCKDRFGSSFEDTVRNVTYPSLVKALDAVTAKAPNATVAILSYPSILPASDGCFPKMPVSKGDVPYLRSLQATLNDAVKRAAAATGVTYVDVATASEGHDACQAGGVRWVEPALLGTNPVIVHPNGLGEANMAALTMRTLNLG